MSDVCTTFCPVFYVSKIFGQANYQVNGTVNNRTFKKSTPSAIYSLLYHTVITVYSIYLYDVKEQNNVSGKKKILLQFHTNISIILTFATAIFNIYHLDTQIDILKRMIVIDKGFKELGLTINYKRHRKFVIILIIYEYLFMIFYYTFGGSFNEPNTNFYLYNLNIILRKNTTLVTMVQIISWMLVIKDRFGIFRKSSLYSEWRLIKIMKLHQELCSATRLINLIYDIVFLIGIGITFGNFVTEAYHIILSSYGGTANLLKLLQSCYSFFGNFLRFAIMMFVCEIVAAEANAMKSFLHRIDITRKNDYVKSQILGFSIQLEHDILKISAMGMFTLDFSLIFLIIAVAISYLIILLQF